MNALHDAILRDGSRCCYIMDCWLNDFVAQGRREQLLIPGVMYLGSMRSTVGRIPGERLAQ